MENLAQKIQDETVSKVVIKGQREVEIQEGQIPEITEDQILVKTLVSGISAGTEGMWYDGSASALKSGRKSYPYFPGYELVGEIVEVGEKVEGYNVGDAIFTMKPHASYAVVGVNDICYKLPQGFAIEKAIAIALTGTALHAVHRSGVTAGDNCVVVGLGVLGLILTQVLSKGLGCRVTAITRSESKKELARKSGAKNVLTHDEAVSQAKELNIFASFDASGTNAGVETAVKAVGNQGRVVTTGFYNEPVNICGEAIFTKELTVLGVRATGSPERNNEHNRWNRFETMQLAYEFVTEGKVDISDIITHKFDFGKIAEAYDMIDKRSEDFLQVILNWR